MDQTFCKRNFRVFSVSFFLISGTHCWFFILHRILLSQYIATELCKDYNITMHLYQTMKHIIFHPYVLCNFIYNYKHIYIYMCPSLTFWVQLLILAILRIWYQLKGLCLKITILNTERKYFYYLCQYHHFEVNAWSIMNRTVYMSNIRAMHFYQYIWG